MILKVLIGSIQKKYGNNKLQEILEDVENYMGFSTGITPVL